MSNEWVKANKKLIDDVESLLQAAYHENEAYHTSLNGDDPLEIPSLDRDRDPYKIDSSAALFWADRESYYDELEFCLVKYHEEAIQHLKANGLVPVFHDLVDAIKLNRITPFVGAGMSGDSGFPLWGEALEDILSKLEGIDPAPIKAKLDASEYLEAAQDLWEHDSDQVKNFIRNRFAKSHIPRTGVSGPITLLPKISKGCIITTNFDLVIEQIFGTLDAYMHGLQQGNKFVPKLIKGGRCILKLHGDAEDYETYVFTEEQYAAGYGSPLDFTKPLPKALRQIFISHSLLFLGCSLGQDKTLELFDKVRRDTEFEIPDHFAILPTPSNPADKNAKEGFLLNLKIRPLWYPSGNHDFVEKYLKLIIDVAEERLTDF